MDGSISIAGGVSVYYLTKFFDAPRSERHATIIQSYWQAVSFLKRHDHLFGVYEARTFSGKLTVAAEQRAISLSKRRQYAFFPSHFQHIISKNGLLLFSGYRSHPSDFNVGFDSYEENRSGLNEYVDQLGEITGFPHLDLYLTKLIDRDNLRAQEFSGEVGYLMSFEQIFNLWNIFIGDINGIPGFSGGVSRYSRVPMKGGSAYILRESYSSSMEQAAILDSIKTICFCFILLSTVRT
ncbi:hypothetical protein [Roseobacter cerasinus]|uniref:hypothetical protein n=1 Tax=Roseobacter cerasinus TaxID=2602289 RepID=UPI00135847DA|nr:hypothetical protein [Roseobacter cerasinus]